MLGDATALQGLQHTEPTPVRCSKIGDRIPEEAISSQEEGFAGAVRAWDALKAGKKRVAIVDIAPATADLRLSRDSAWTSREGEGRPRVVRLDESRKGLRHLVDLETI